MIPVFERVKSIFAFFDNILLKASFIVCNYFSSLDYIIAVSAPTSLYTSTHVFPGFVTTVETFFFSPSLEDQRYFSQMHQGERQNKHTARAPHARANTWMWGA